MGKDASIDEITYKTLAPTMHPSAIPTQTDSTTISAGGKSASASITTDEYLVYSTVLLFAVVMLVCGGLWCARPAKRPKPHAIEQDLESGRAKGSRKETTIKKVRETGSVLSSSTAGGKRKSKKTKSPIHDGFDDTREGNVGDTDSIASEASSLLAGEEIAAAAGGGRNTTLLGSQLNQASMRTGASNPYKDLSPQDEALRKTFHSVLKEGMTMLLHTGDKIPKQIQLTLVGTELRWKAAKVFARNHYKIDLRDIKYVEWGKQTSTFQKHPSMGAADDLCFSLITDKVTVDLEASSKVERDALVQGFSLVVGGLRMSGSV